MIVKNSIKKSKTWTIVLLLSLTMSPIIASLIPAANAANVTTYAYLYVGPNPIGVGQPVSVVMWLDKMPPINAQNAAMTYDNYTLQITKPDGSTSTMGPYKSDYIASKSIIYTPDTIGTYYFQFKYLGQIINSRRAAGQPVANDSYLASSSPKMTLTVQQTQIPTTYAETPLPTDYWNRPIEEENREWGTIGGNWLGLPLQFANGYDFTGSFAPYSKAPNSAHIVWTKPLIFGGIVGGELGDKSFYTGLSYEEKWNPPAVVVIAGRMYYHIPLSNWPTGGGLACVDLRTGEEYWWKNMSISFGQLLNFDSMNQHGVLPYLWTTGSTYTMYDALTGNQILTMANASNGKIIYDENGNLLSYVMNAGRSWLAMWNSTRVTGLQTLTGATEGYQWRPPVGGNLNWLTGVQWNVTIPSIPSQSLTLASRDVLITTKPYLDVDPPVNQLTGYSAKTGAYMWAFNISDYAMIGRSNYLFGPIVDGVFTYFDQAKMVWYGYDANTGRQIWGPTKPYESPWGVYSQSYRGAGQPFVQVGYGKLYATAYDGTVHCFDLKTGTNLWNFYSGSSGYETPYGNYPMYGGVTIADSKIYISSNEHSPNSPNWRGGKLFCIDANNGTLLWSVLGWMPGPIVADGYLAALNSYDGQIYCFGKGKTATTVSAPQTTVTFGSGVLIQGTVTDQSPGAKDTPAISDESMSHWMEYQYMQKTKPNNATGVKVHLTAIDPNGNYQDLGTAQSDDSGFYNLLWTPPVNGKYVVTASFEGSQSYWPSSSKTAFAVAQATPTASPAATPNITPTQAPTITPIQTLAPSPTQAVQPPTSEMPTATYLAIGTAIVVIVAAAAVLVLRKRK